MRLLAFLLLAFMVSGCEKEISRKLVSKIDDIRPVQCTHAGLCMDCGLSFGGKFDCNFRFKPHCSGMQKARVSVSVFDVMYDSGTTRKVEKIEIIERIGHCS